MLKQNEERLKFEIEVGKETLSKKRNALEQIAYSDTWGKGSDSFLSYIYEKLKLIQNLLSDDGSILLHCDWRLNSALRLVLDEIFGEKNFVNEIVWCYQDIGSRQTNYFKKMKNLRAKKHKYQA